MPEVIEIGGLALNGMLLTALIAALAGYGSLRLWTARERTSRSGPWGDLTAVAALIAIAIWKFGVLFREPSLLWEQPLLLLVIVGSGAEAFAGLAAAALFWIWQSRRKGIGLLLALDALTVSAAGGLLIWNLLSAIEYRWGYAVVCAILLAVLIGRQAPVAVRAAGERTDEKKAGEGEAVDGFAGQTTNGDAAGFAEPAADEGTTGPAGATGDVTGPAGATGDVTGPAGASDEVTGLAGTTGDVTGLAGATGDVTALPGQTAAGDASGTAGVSAGSGVVRLPDRSAGAPAGSGAARQADRHGEAAVLAGYVLGAGCLVVSLFAPPPPWVKPPAVAGLTSTQLVFIAAGLAAAALDAYRSRSGG